MNDENNQPLIQMHGVNKFFGAFQALKNINLDVRRGERIVVCGPSGSGKSTMIRCINRLEEHNNGHIIIDGKELTDKVKDINAVRREVGMVFQSFNLFPHMTIVKNLMLAQQLVRKVSKVEARETAMLYLQRVKIPEQADKYPIQLSGGQQQRVAIGRVLMHQPRLILADEPTGNLDEATSHSVMELFTTLVKETGSSLLMVTHSQVMANYLDHQWLLQAGQITPVLARDT